MYNGIVILFSVSKKMISSICDTMHYFVKQDKPITGQILYDSIYMNHLSIVHFLKTNNRNNIMGFFLVMQESKMVIAQGVEGFS